MYACAGDCTADFANSKLLQVRRQEYGGVETVEIKVTTYAKLHLPDVEID